MRGRENPEARAARLAVAPDKKKRPRGVIARGRQLPRRDYFVLSISIAAFAFEEASEEFPALHAASASVTRPEAFLKSADRGACSS